MPGGGAGELEQINKRQAPDQESDVKEGVILPFTPPNSETASPPRLAVSCSAVIE